MKIYFHQINEKTMVEAYNQQLRDFPHGPVVKTSPSNVWNAGFIPGQRAKNLHRSQLKQTNTPQEQHCNKLNKDF